MSPSELGHEILDTLWEFGRPGFIAFVACLVWGLSIGRQTIKRNLATAGIVVGIPGFMAIFYFLNIEGGNILRLSRARPMWGGYVALLAVSTTAMILRMATLAFQGNGRIYDLHLNRLDDKAVSVETPGRMNLILGVVWLTLSVVAVVWLWLIARGNE
jgi:hypothetical protein